MNATPFSARLRLLLICLLLAAGPESGAQPTDAYRDSLYTYAYLKHRLHLCTQRFKVPRPELRRLQAAASVADSLAKRWPHNLGGPDAYLPVWAAHPELDEDGARVKLGLPPRPAPGTCLLDTAGYAARRKRLTALQTRARTTLRRGDTAVALAMLDTIGREYVFSGAVFDAKRLAIASRDTAAYLNSLAQTTYSGFAEARRKELRWPVAVTAAQKAFVRACLQLVDSDAIAQSPQVPAELRRCLLSFADQQNIYSECLIAGGKLPPLLKPHKAANRRIYCFMAEETYTVMPGVVCRYLDVPDRVSKASFSLIGYFSLHLIQLNAFGQIYPDSLFENYTRFIRQLAYAQKADMEDYASLRDEYLMLVKGRPSEYGYGARRKGFELSYSVEPSEAVRARREAELLLPLEIAAARE